MRRHSLVLRIVGCLFFAQIIAFTIAWLFTIGLGLAGVDIFATSLDELSAIRAKKQVVAALAMNDAMMLEFRPPPDLVEDLARAPGMKFAAFKGLSRDPVAGSSPELVAMLRPLIEISPTHVHFVLPGDPSAIRAGLMEPLWTPFGRLHIAVYGQKFRWSDIFYVAVEDMRWLIWYFVMATVMSAGAAWFAVRWGLRPLRRAAEQAAGIDMNSLHQRLDANDVSSEVGPLVDAVNDALARLDAGVARQKRFAANAAHELRTPVNVLGVRLDAPEEPTFKNDLKRDHRRIRNIVEQLLASARLGEQTTKLDETINLVALARTMIADAALLALKARRRIVLESPSAPVLVKGNRPALEFGHRECHRQCASRRAGRRRGSCSCRRERNARSDRSRLRGRRSGPRIGLRGLLAKERNHSRDGPWPRRREGNRGRTRRPYLGRGHAWRRGDVQAGVSAIEGELKLAGLLASVADDARELASQPSI